MPPRARTPGPLTHVEAREWTSYEPETGIVRWIKPKPRVTVGMRAGNVHPKGYRYICVCGENFRENVYIWFWMTGERVPAGLQVDHKNLHRDQNWWGNLRLSTQGQNQGNTPRYGKLRGVMRRDYATGPVWRVRVPTAQGRRDIGQFYSEEEALAVYAKYAKEHFGEFYFAA